MKVGDQILCLVDEYHNGNKEQTVGTILYFHKGYASIVYLSGHHSRNDDIPKEDIQAVVDESKPWITIGQYSGYFNTEITYED